MIRENDVIGIDGNNYVRKEKCNDTYFLDIKRELKRIERAKTKANNYSKEQADKMLVELNMEEEFWKNELNHIQNPQRKFKKKFEKKKLEQIRQEILKIIEEKRLKNEDSLCLSNIALQLNVKEKYVFQILDQLNKEGIVSQPNHIKPHDVFRPYSNGWCDDIYEIRK